ncbi:MAG: hypothetical protein Q8N18_26750 [Opitutaceae bacterium]|nr:hypothetical protein [Opitutaceae bacterium]
MDHSLSSLTPRSNAWQSICDLWKEVGSPGPGFVDLVFGRDLPAAELAEAWFLRSGSATAGYIFSIEVIGGSIPSERFESLDSERLSTRLAAFPPRSSVAILDLAHLRFPNLDISNGLESRSSEDVTVRPQLGATLPLAHIFQLGLRAAAIAAERDLHILLVCSGEVIPTEIPQAVEECPNLSVIYPQPSKVETAFLGSWNHATAAFKSQGINAALALIESSGLDPVNKAVQRSQFLAAEGLHVRAFEELKPHLAEIEAPAEGLMLLGLAQSALLAGDREEATRLMETALRSHSLGFEGLRTAIITADKLDRDDWVARLRHELTASFPSHPFTREQQWLAAAEQADIQTCLSLAQAAGDAYRIALAQYWGVKPFNPGRFVEQVKPLGRTQDAIWQIARHLARNNDLAGASRYARMVDPSTEWVERAIELRAKCLRDAIPPLTPEELEPELRELMVYCAAHPAHLRARFSVERTLESEISGPVAFASLLHITTLEMSRVTGLIPESFAHPLAASEAKFKTGPDGKAAMALIEDCMIRLGPKPNIVIGSGSIPAEFKSRVTPQLIAVLMHAILETVNKRDWDTAQMLTHWIILFAEVLGDAHADLHAILLLLMRMSAAGEAQRGRDVAEKMLLMVPGKQPVVADWRRAILWTGFADNWLRSHNPRQALNCIAHACLLITSPPTHPGLTADLFRALGQVFRDLGFYSSAKHAIATEQAIVTRNHHLAFRRIQVEQMALSVRCAELADEPDEAELIQLGHDAAAILREEDDDLHVAPSLSIIGNSISQLRTYGWQVPPDLQLIFDTNLPRVPAVHRAQLSNSAGANVSVRSLKHLLGTLSTARYASDIPNQIRPALLPAHRALEAAVVKRHTPLFALGHAILAQPAIALAQLAREKSRHEDSAIGNARWLSKQIEQNASPERILDAVKLQRAASDKLVPLSFASLSDSPVTEWQQHLSPNEAIVLVGKGNANSVLVMIGLEGTWQSPAKSPLWSHDAYERWRVIYPAAYDLWLYEDRHVLKPTPTDVAASLSELSPVGPIGKPHLIVIPSTELFGFTFPLALREHGHDAAMSIAPSAIWLTRRRATRTAIAPRSVAWLGGPTSADEILVELRTRLTPVLAAGRFTVDSGVIPTECHGAELALIGSHGAQGLLQTFSHVTDREETFTPDELAATVAGSRCVILFICHSGQVDREPFTQEAKGLVSALLRRDIDCVIAAPWPLDIRPAAKWLGYFLATDPALSVAIRADQAHATLATAYDNHPIIRSLLTVYGDGGTVVSTTSR